VIPYGKLHSVGVRWSSINSYIHDFYLYMFDTILNIFVAYKLN